MCLEVLISIISLGVKGDMVWSCALPGYKGTATRSRQCHINVILNGLTNEKKTFVKFLPILPWNDLEVILAWPLEYT